MEKESNTYSLVDLEHQIDKLVNDAGERMLEGNLYAAENLLKRALKEMKELRGPEHLQVAGLYSKLSIIQSQQNKEVESNLNYNAALDLYFKNNNDDEPLSNNILLEEEPTMRIRQRKKKKKKRKKKNNGAGKSPPKIFINEVTKKDFKPLNVNIEQVYYMPHHTMQYVGGEIAVPRKITNKDLTPRSRNAIVKTGIDVNSIRIRDIHSFYNANPKLSMPEREDKFVLYSQRRDILYKELLENREIAMLKFESDKRMHNLLDNQARERESFKVAAYGLAKTGYYDEQRRVARSVIPTDPTADKYRGSVVAAISMMKTPVQTPNKRHRGRPPRIKAEPGQLVCPA